MANQQPTNLYSYFQGQGQALPSLQERSQLYQQAGFGSAQSYLAAGTNNAPQNQQLLGYLQGLPKPPKSPTKPIVAYDSKLSKQNNSIQQQGMDGLDKAIDQHAQNQQLQQMQPKTYEGQLNQIQGQQEDAYTQWNNAMTQIANGTFPLSRYEKQQIQSTQKQFDELKQLQVTANKGYEALQKQAQFRQGTNITDPTQFLALNQQVIDQDIKKVGNIDNEANKAVAELKQSFLDKDYKMINDQYSKLSDLLKSKTDTIDKIQTRADKMANDLRDYNLQVQKFNYQKEQDRALASQAVAGKTPTGKPDYTTAGYANRATEANKIIQDLEANNPKLLTGVFAGGLRRGPNRAIPPKIKQFEQAKRNFVNAVLRKESGAAISPEEFKSAIQQYFAEPGDDPQTVLQKQRNRIDAANALIGGSGTAYTGAYLDKPSQYMDASFDDSGDSYLDQALYSEEDSYSTYANTL